MSSLDVLIRPLVTEKSMSGVKLGCYAFHVILPANKIEIKKAIEEYYGVKVSSVRTSIVRGKFRRSGRVGGKRSNWKKAYVQLSEGQSISLFDN